MKKKSIALPDATTSQANADAVVEKDTSARKRGWSLGASKAAKAEEKPVVPIKGTGAAKNAVAAKASVVAKETSAPVAAEKPKRGRPALPKADPVLRSISPAAEDASAANNTPAAASTPPPVEKPRRGRPVGSVKTPAAVPATKGKRGRPKKITTTSEVPVAKVESGVAPIPKRGRPPKAKSTETATPAVTTPPLINPTVTTFVAEAATNYVANDDLSEKIIRLEKRILKIQKKLIKLKRKAKG
jgi:hypothetical protein